jgi:hypothetical protein
MRRAGKRFFVDIPTFKKPCHYCCRWFGRGTDQASWCIIVFKIDKRVI